MKYYVDSCIYLNLWHKEISRDGKPLWKFALDFFQNIEDLNSEICYSGFIIKELKYILKEEEFKQKIKIFEKSNFKKIIAVDEDFKEARKLESESNYEISFYDCFHVVLAKKSDSILITRDNKLIDFAKGFIEVKKPEWIL